MFFEGHSFCGDFVSPPRLLLAKARRASERTGSCCAIGMLLTLFSDELTLTDRSCVGPAPPRYLRRRQQLGAPAQLALARGQEEAVRCLLLRLLRRGVDLDLGCCLGRRLDRFRRGLHAATYGISIKAGLVACMPSSMYGTEASKEVAPARGNTPGPRHG